MPSASIAPTKRGGVQIARWDDCRTYTEIDFATFRHFFRENLQEFQHAITGAASQGGAHRGEDVLPVEHLDGQTGQAHAELRLYRAGTGRESHQQIHDGVSQRHHRFGRKLVQVEHDLVPSVSILSCPDREEAAAAPTFPFNVVAANNLASTGTSGDCNSSWVIVHAST